MEEAVGIRKLRDELTRQIARVRRGKRLVVTDRGRRVAVLVPYGRDARSRQQDRLRTLLTGGHVAPAERPFFARPPLVKGRGPLVSDLIGEDRR